MLKLMCPGDRLAPPEGAEARVDDAGAANKSLRSPVLEDGRAPPPVLEAVLAVAFPQATGVGSTRKTRRRGS